MNISKPKIIAVICLLVSIIALVASKMIVWEPAHTLKDWKVILLEAVSTADRVSVYETGGENALLACGGNGHVQRFLNSVIIDESTSETVMMPGRFKLSFETENEVLISIEIVGGTHLRWRGGNWPSDAKLMPSSSKAVQAWLVDIGVSD